MRRLIALVLVTCLAGLGGFYRGSTSRERADLPIESLEAGANVVFVGTCVRIEEKSSRGSGFEDTTYFHHMKVDRVCRAAGGIKVGDTVAVISQKRGWVGSGTPPTYGSGHRGMPGKNEQKRVYCRFNPDNQGKGSEGLLWLNALEPNGWQPPARTVMFVAGDDEYRSEITLPKLAEWLAKDAPGVITPIHGFPCDPAKGVLDLERRDHISNLDKLEAAEVAVMYMRFRDLDAPSWKHLEQFLMNGRPLVGLRTSTHMLRTNDPEKDNELPIRVFGQKWIRHAGSDTRTRVLTPEADHPIVRGMKGDFVVRSWLYEVLPLPADCTVLLWGEVEGGKPGTLARQPLLWVREAKKDTVRPLGDRGYPARRMAFTTLGHPEDFENEEVRAMVERMVLWACEEEGAWKGGK